MVVVVGVLAAVAFFHIGKTNNEFLVPRVPLVRTLSDNDETKILVVVVALVVLVVWNPCIVVAFCNAIININVKNRIGFFNTDTLLLVSVGLYVMVLSLVFDDFLTLTFNLLFSNLARTKYAVPLVLLPSPFHCLPSLVCVSEKTKRYLDGLTVSNRQQTEQAKKNCNSWKTELLITLLGSRQNRWLLYYLLLLLRE